MDNDANADSSARAAPHGLVRFEPRSTDTGSASFLAVSAVSLFVAGVPQLTLFWEGRHGAFAAQGPMCFRGFARPRLC